MPGGRGDSHRHRGATEPGSRGGIVLPGRSGELVGRDATHSEAAGGGGVVLLACGSNAHARGSLVTVEHRARIGRQFGSQTAVGSGYGGKAVCSSSQSSCRSSICVVLHVERKKIARKTGQAR